MNDQCSLNNMLIYFVWYITYNTYTSLCVVLHCSISAYLSSLLEIYTDLIHTVFVSLMSKISRLFGFWNVNRIMETKREVWYGLFFNTVCTMFVMNQMFHATVYKDLKPGTMINNYWTFYFLIRFYVSDEWISSNISYH